MGIRISEMEEATTFGADDYVPIVTSGTNKKALGSKIKDFIAGFFVSKSGDTMTGKLTLGAAPTENMDATTKKYVDDSITPVITTRTVDGIEWTIIKSGIMYDMFAIITIPANTTPATWGGLYVYRNSTQSRYELPVTLTKKIADVTSSDGLLACIQVSYTDISNNPNKYTVADIARPTTTTSAISVNKYIRGYVL